MAKGFPGQNNVSNKNSWISNEHTTPNETIASAENQFLLKDEMLLRH